MAEVRGKAREARGRLRMAWTALRRGGWLVTGLSSRQRDKVESFAVTLVEVDSARARFAKAEAEVRDVQDRILYPYDLCEPEEEVFV